MKKAPTRAAVEVKELLLGQPKWTLAVAESLTCGRLQAAIGAMSGASGYFLGGVTAYTLDQKVQLLGVDRRAAKKVNCVSAGVAEAMAAGAARMFGADFAVATTGYAEPADAVAVPFAWWAIARRRRGKVTNLAVGRVECPGATRTEVQTMVAEAALAELVAVLRAARGGRLR
jgi:nicotinamide-nucleotide amidase